MCYLLLLVVLHYSVLCLPLSIFFNLSPLAAFFLIHRFFCLLSAVLVTIATTINNTTVRFTLHIIFSYPHSRIIVISRLVPDHRYRHYDQCPLTLSTILANYSPVYTSINFTIQESVRAHASTHNTTNFQLGICISIFLWSLSLTHTHTHPSLPSLSSSIPSSLNRPTHTSLFYTHANINKHTNKYT